MCIFFVNFERGGTEEEDTAATFEKADARRRRRKPKKGENKVRAREKKNRFRFLPVAVDVTCLLGVVGKLLH